MMSPYTWELYWAHQSAHEKHSRTILFFVCIANSTTAKTVRNKYIKNIYKINVTFV